MLMWWFQYWFVFVDVLSIQYGTIDSLLCHMNVLHIFSIRNSAFSTTTAIKNIRKKMKNRILLRRTRESEKHIKCSSAQYLQLACYRFKIKNYTNKTERMAWEKKSNVKYWYVSMWLNVRINTWKEKKDENKRRLKPL